MAKKKFTPAISNTEPQLRTYVRTIGNRTVSVDAANQKEADTKFNAIINPKPVDTEAPAPVDSDTEQSND